MEPTTLQHSQTREEAIAPHADVTDVGQQSVVSSTSRESVLIFGLISLVGGIALWKCLNHDTLFGRSSRRHVHTGAVLFQTSEEATSFFTTAQKSGEKKNTTRKVMDNQDSAVRNRDTSISAPVPHLQQRIRFIFVNLTDIEAKWATSALEKCFDISSTSPVSIDFVNLLFFENQVFESFNSLESSLIDRTRYAFHKLVGKKPTEDVAQSTKCCVVVSRSAFRLGAEQQQQQQRGTAATKRASVDSSSSVTSPSARPSHMSTAADHPSGVEWDPFDGDENVEDEMLDLEENFKRAPHLFEGRTFVERQGLGFTLDGKHVSIISQDVKGVLHIRVPSRPSPTWHSPAGAGVVGYGGRANSSYSSVSEPAPTISYAGGGVVVPATADMATQLRSRCVPSSLSFQGRQVKLPQSFTNPLPCPSSTSSASLSARGSSQKGSVADRLPEFHSNVHQQLFSAATPPSPRIGNDTLPRIQTTALNGRDWPIAFNYSLFLRLAATLRFARSQSEVPSSALDTTQRDKTGMERVYSCFSWLRRYFFVEADSDDCSFHSPTGNFQLIVELPSFFSRDQLERAQIVMQNFFSRYPHLPAGVGFGKVYGSRWNPGSLWLACDTTVSSLAFSAQKDSVRKASVLQIMDVVLQLAATLSAQGIPFSFIHVLLLSSNQVDERKEVVHKLALYEPMVSRDENIQNRKGGMNQLSCEKESEVTKRKEHSEWAQIGCAAMVGGDTQTMERSPITVDLPNTVQEWLNACQNTTQYDFCHGRSSEMVLTSGVTVTHVISVDPPEANL